MKNKTLAVIAAILVLCSLIFCGCEVNINLPENPSENSSGTEAEESQSSSESEPNSALEESEPIHENNEDPDSYEKLINEMYYKEYAFGEAFIGYVEGPMGTGYEEFFEECGYMEEYPFIAEIPYERYIETDGNEMYCIVPRDKNSSVAVNEWIYSPTGGTYGEVLYRSESGEPIIITCNEDGSNPNVKIVIVDSEGNVFEFSPYFNSQLGWLEVYETPEARAHDFTVYENSSDNDILVFEDLLGDWAGFYTTPEGDEVQFHFNFYRAAYGEPCVTFWYGEEYGEYIEYYEGYAYEQYDENGDFTGSLILELTLTQGTNSAEKGPILLMSTYEFRRAGWDENWIVVSCTGGGSLLEEYGLGWFEMAQTMG